MSAGDNLLIIGAGHAGAELAITARQQGWGGHTVLIGDEGVHPYQRPPLSKTHLAQDAPGEPVLIRPPEAYEKAGVEFMPGVRVARIERDAHKLVLEGGRELPYAKLALCTGGRPRLLTLPAFAGKTPANLHYLRTGIDAAAIRANLQPGAHLVVIGGGYVGLEVAASARKAGATVTVLEAQPRVLARVTGPAMSAFYQQVHGEEGVDVRTGVGVQDVMLGASGAISEVICSDGTRIACNLVVAGIGMLPNVELAVQAGLVVEQGIVVNASSTTSDPDIYAAGDCYDRRYRQAITAAGMGCRAAIEAERWLAGH